MEEQESVTLSGQVVSIIHHNAQNGYTVMELETPDQMVTAVGSFAQIEKGEKLTVVGSFSMHKTYGEQFVISSYTQDLPATSGSILAYLTGAKIKGIGPSTAKRIVEMFGDDTLDVLENNPQRLCAVKGITAEKAQQIGEAFAQQYGVRMIMMYLSAYGIAPYEAVAIYKKFGQAAKQKIEEDPYVVCSLGVSFERAELIAQQQGVPLDAPCRVDAGVRHVLGHNLLNGHTCLPRDKLAASAEQLLGVSSDDIEISIDNQVERGKLCADVKKDKPFLFLPHMHEAEQFCAGRLAMMLDYHTQAEKPLGDLISQIEQELGIRYESKQKQAIEAAYEQGVLILTGGPGTGKTTTLNGIIKAFEHAGLKVALCAPTGRAAKRIQELTGYEAKTIHRLLEVGYGDDELQHFNRHERNPLDADVVIVDEISMVDVLLFESLLRAVRLGARLIMVGDVNQLPPVGAGNVLRDLIKSERIPLIELTEVFRQAAESLIIVNAHKIVTGEYPDLTIKDNDFFFLPCMREEVVAHKVVDLASRRLPAAYGFSPAWDIQVLCPSRKGLLGTESLNRMLQERLNPFDPYKPQHVFGSVTFRQGDKVMQSRNNYDISYTRDNGERGSAVYNGDIGVIEQIQKSQRMMRIRFDDRVAEYGFDMLNDLELAYAVTVHKSQGSEFEAVVMPVFSGPDKLFYRNLLYTAVTRAKSLLVIAGSEHKLHQMIDVRQKSNRYSFLCQYLKEACTS